MNRQSAERAVLLSALVIGGIFAYRKLTEPAFPSSKDAKSKNLIINALGYGPVPDTGRFITAMGFAFTVIGVVTEIAPAFGASLAVIFATSDVLANGVAIAQDVQTGLGNKDKAPDPTPPVVNGVPVPEPGESNENFQKRLNAYLMGRVNSGTLMTQGHTEKSQPSNPLLQNPLTGQANPLIK